MSAVTAYISDLVKAEERDVFDILPGVPGDSDADMWHIVVKISGPYFSVGAAEEVLLLLAGGLAEARAHDGLPDPSEAPPSDWPPDL